MSLMRALLYCLFLSLVLPNALAQVAAQPVSTPARSSPPEPTLVRVALASGYVDALSEEKVRKGGAKWLQNVSQSAGGRFRFQLAVGSQDEVLDWYKRGLVQVAQLAPASVASLLLSSPADWRDELENLYLGSKVLRRAPGQDRTFSKAVCVVRNDSPVRTIEDIRQLVKEGRLERKDKIKILVASRRSISYIVPTLVLGKSYGIDFGRLFIEATGDHDKTLEALSVPDVDGLPKVAFIHGRLIPSNSDLRVISIPELNDIRLPSDLLLLGKGFKEHQKELANAILSNKAAEGDLNFVADAEWRRSVEKLAALLESSPLRLADRVQLDEIVASMERFSAQTTKPPRLALVLSGGGAKCAYQLGAIRAIEDELDAHVDKNGNRKVDIDLVVGTSGGAINGLFVALGLTKDPRGMTQLEHEWRNFSPDDFFRPPAALRNCVGLGLALIQALIIVALISAVIFLARLKNENWWKVAGLLMALVVIADLLISQTALAERILTLTRTRNNTLRYALMLSTYGLGWSIPWLLGMSALTLVLGLAVSRKRELIKPFRRWVVTGLASTTVLASLCAVTYFFVHVQSLSEATGLEETLTKSTVSLLGKDNLALDEGTLRRSAREQLEPISNAIMGSRLLKRDLIITGSVLPPDKPPRDEQSPSATIPNDILFYWSAKRTFATETPNDRFVSLDNNPSILLDTVIASSSIYPVFPARRVSVRLSDGETHPLEIIDGGFLHNSPVLAAVYAGATHIILVEASPEEKPSERRDILDNAVTAFDYLFNQAQVSDKVIESNVAVFQIKPLSCYVFLGDSPDAPCRQPSSFSTFDFSQFSVMGATDLGSSDASSGAIRLTRAKPRLEDVSPF
jgi:predicted acylesterase/phospholipase RssA